MKIKTIRLLSLMAGFAILGAIVYFLLGDEQIIFAMINCSIGAIAYHVTTGEE